MPMHIYLKGGGKLSLKGDTMETAVVKRGFLWWRIWKGIALNGHDISTKAWAVLAWELQPEAEVKAIEQIEQAKAKAIADASKCKRCGAMSPHEAGFCAKCGAVLVKKQLDEPRLVVPGGRP